ncbi:MAG: dihydrodipicolinate synthase family protein [Planctomycetes bacterium]|nr:dihydrodipicolinate synthase family protein [Planctomycetota bacterium]
MPKLEWTGVLPAITTPFRDDGEVDHAFLARHCRWLVDQGCRGVVALGSLGEGATLEPDEKHAILETCVHALQGKAPVIAGVAALSTRRAVRIAQDAERVGCKGLMVLPAYVHKGEWREARAHVSAVMAASGLPCMLYNNPIAYGTDFQAPQVAELAARHANLQAVKESSGDARRVTALRALLDGRLTLLIGLDDMVTEGVEAGARGWVAGLANALPGESVRLFELALAGRREEAFALYRWFLPLLRMDTVPEFVQLIKLVQHEVGMGGEHVRRPRLPLEGPARDAALATIRAALASRPAS